MVDEDRLAVTSPVGCSVTRVTTVSLRDLLLRPGDIARATGTLERTSEGPSGRRLWVQLSHDPSGARQVEGGSIGVVLRPDLPGVDLLDPSALVTVEGRWTGRSLEEASYRVATDPQTMPTVLGGELPSPYPCSDEEYGAIGEEMSAAAAPVALGTGSSWERQAMIIQLLYVTDRFLRWYEDFTAARVDVDVSVYPA